MTDYLEHIFLLFYETLLDFKDGDSGLFEISFFKTVIFDID
jgi:hypothetical protein